MYRSVKKKGAGQVRGAETTRRAFLLSLNKTATHLLIDGLGNRMTGALTG